MIGSTKPRAARAAALLLAAAAAGCVPVEDAKTSGKAAVAPGEAFRPPAPGGAADDPRVVAAAAAGEAVAEKLVAVRARLAAVRTAYDARARAEQDLLAAARKLRPIVAAARGDCDVILRAARDLRRELGHAGDGYRLVADLYRKRADGYADPEFRALSLRFAAEFDRQADDVPRRLALTEAFVGQMVEAQVWLAETERSLGDTAAALALLSAGSGPPPLSAEAGVFRRRLEEFIAAVQEYQEKLFPSAPAPQPAPAPAPPRPDPPSEPAAPRVAERTRAAAQPKPQARPKPVPAPAGLWAAQPEPAGPTPFQLGLVDGWGNPLTLYPMWQPPNSALPPGMFRIGGSPPAPFPGNSRVRTLDQP